MIEVQVAADKFLRADVRQGEMVWVKRHSFANGNDGCWGYVRGLYSYGITVRLELDDANPSMAEAIADTGLDGDNVELEDVVPFDGLEHQDGSPVRVWTRGSTDGERASRARRRGFERLSLPELDAHFAGRRSGG